MHNTVVATVLFDFHQSDLFVLLHMQLFCLQNLIGVAHNSVRFRSGLPINTVVLFVPQQEAWVVERFGKFHRVLEPVSRVSFYCVLLPSLLSVVKPPDPRTGISIWPLHSMLIFFG